MQNFIQSGDDAIECAVNYVAQGRVVAIPTETVYGLAADARNSEAVKEIYRLKKRNNTVPMQVLVKDLEQARRLAVFDSEALDLAEAFWPGPLTLVLPLRVGADVAPEISVGAGGTIGIRISANDLVQKLLYKYGRPLVASSANISGESSPVTANEVLHAFGDQLPLIIDGSLVDIGISSTVWDTINHRMLREGSITHEQIEEVRAASLEER